MQEWSPWKAKALNHQPSPHRSGYAFGNHHVGRGIVATQRDPGAKEADHQGCEVRREGQCDQKAREDDRLGNEHPLAAEVVGQPSECAGADQDASQRCGGHQALVGGCQPELDRNQRQRNTGHEYDHALEELACGGKAEDAPLHAGHRRGCDGRKDLVAVLLLCV